LIVGCLVKARVMETMLTPLPTLAVPFDCGVAALRTTDSLLYPGVLALAILLLVTDIAD